MTSTPRAPVTASATRTPPTSLVNTSGCSVNRRFATYSAFAPPPPQPQTYDAVLTANRSRKHPLPTGPYAWDGPVLLLRWGNRGRGKAADSKQRTAHRKRTVSGQRTIDFGLILCFARQGTLNQPALGSNPRGLTHSSANSASSLSQQPTRAKKCGPKQRTRRRRCKERPSRSASSCQISVRHAALGSTLCGVVPCRCLVNGGIGDASS